MEREQALNLLKQNLQNQNLLKHSLAVEAAMRQLARHFGENEDQWGICGLLHDIDYKKSQGDPSTHSKLGYDMLKEQGLDEETCQAVLTHNEAHGIAPESKMAKALFCVDPLTGLIVASTLVLPNKKISELKTENVLNRLPEKSFAKGAKREIINMCEGLLGIALEKFIEIALGGMQDIAETLGL